MHRADGIYLFSLICLGCGLAASWAAMAATGVRLSAALLLVLGALGPIATMLVLRATCRRVIAAARDPQKFPFPGHCDVSPTGFRFFDNALIDLSEATARAVADARLSARELEIQLKLAEAERSHAQAILYSISDSVLVTNPFDELVLANEAAARTFNFDLAKSKRAPAEKLLGDPRMTALIREMRQSHSRNGRRVVEHTVRCDGLEKTYRVTLSTVTDGDAPAGVVAVMRDVTREKEVAQMKNDFVSMVSHELRTPLASIRAYVEMLIDGEAADGQTEREFYDVIQSESQRLGRLIDNILNISRIESGLVKVHKEPQSLAIIAKDAIEVIAPQARQKNITLTEDLAAPVYQTQGDRDMLYQAMLNLLSNAVKYTPAGGTVSVQISVDPRARKLITRINDTGVGIPPKDLPFVFDKFFRAEANNRMAPGTGLGLSLVKHIIETVHGGRMFLESHVGTGSSFGFDLELSEEPEAR